ncbi:hypothetical protein IKE82_01040, partial [Candidatus Saccharibacteria bacterium]|nr:hypothetical protein [Candidatus Saccharibacteria bacterium]
MYNIKQWKIAALMLFSLALVIIFTTSNAFAEDSAGKDVLHAVTMTYDQDIVDIYNNVYVVSIDDQKDITLDFDVEEGFYGVKTILLRDITEDGEAK